MSAVEKFPILLSEAEEESSAVPPCFSDEGINVRKWVCMVQNIWLFDGVLRRLEALFVKKGRMRSSL